MFAALTPSPIAHWLTAIPVCSPRTAAAKDSLTSLTWTWRIRSTKRSQNATGSRPAMNELPVSRLRFRNGLSQNASICASRSGSVVK